MWTPTFGQWQTWTPNSGPLTISFANGEAINSLWLPEVPVPITVSVNNTAIYVANALGSETGAETIPLPLATTTVTLSGSYASPIYVFSSNAAFAPFKEVPIVGVEAVTATSPLQSSGGTTPNISLLISTNPGNLLSVVGGALYAGYPYLCRMRLSGADVNPASTGADSETTVVIPWEPKNDTTVLTWNVIDMFARCETAGSSNTEVRVAYSTGTGAFSSAGFVDTSGIIISSGANESTRPVSIAVPQLQSGWKVQSNYAALGTGMGGLSVYMILEQAV